MIRRFALTVRARERARLPARRDPAVGPVARPTSRSGIVRNRVFANTYGAGAELDAYNAAFRIPEIALDVLVAAGLTAPFVPIFSRLRDDDGDDRRPTTSGGRC